MSKVVPTFKYEVKEATPVTASEKVSDTSSEEGVATSSEHASSLTRPFILRVCLSIRLFIILVITMVVLTACLSIWAASYKVNQDQSLKAVEILIENIQLKIDYFLRGQLMIPMQIAQQLTLDNLRSVLSMDNSARNYLFNKFKVYDVSIATICYGENGLNALQAVSHDEENGWLYGTQNPNETFLLYAIDGDSGDIIEPVYEADDYFVWDKDYYIESYMLFEKYPHGAFSSIYQVDMLGGIMEIFYTVPLYNRTEPSARLGLAKVNTSLSLIASFLSKVKVLEKGFVIVAELASDMVIGSSLNITELAKGMVPTTNISTNDAGKIMEAYYRASNGSNGEFLVSYDGDGYIVSSTTFLFENLQWRLVLVFYEDEVMQGVISSSYIIIGVTGGVCLLGVIASIFIGYIVTKPFHNLERDFKKIESLDLDSIVSRKSLFSESAYIYASLTSTVNWLREFKSFLPDSVLNKLNESYDEKEKVKETPKEESMRHNSSAPSKPPLKHSNSQFSSDSTQLRSSNLSKVESQLSIRHNSNNNRKDNKSLFKIGMSIKECCILNVSINNLCEKSFDDDTLDQIISKALTSISTICKTVKADLQIKSHDEYVIIFSERQNASVHGMETALKILQGIGSVNESLSKNGHSKLELSIGVSSGKALQGNVGNLQTRYFAMVGDTVNRARVLCFMSMEFNTPILVDSTTFKHGDKQFVYRPVDRIIENKKIINIYELIRKNVVESDEWLYELEQQNKNLEHVAFAKAVENLFKLSEKESEQLEPVRQILLSYFKDHPKDRVAERLYRLINIEAKDFTNYHSQVSKRVTSFIDFDNPIT